MTDAREHSPPRDGARDGSGAEKEDKYKEEKEKTRDRDRSISRDSRSPSRRRTPSRRETKETRSRSRSNRKASKGRSRSRSRGDRRKSRSRSRRRSRSRSRSKGGGETHRWKKPTNNTARAGCKLYVGNLSFDTDEQRLEAKFGKFGRITDVYIPLDGAPGESGAKPKGFAFVSFDDPRDANDAMQSLDGREVLLMLASQFMLRSLLRYVIISTLRHTGKREPAKTCVTHFTLHPL